MATLELQFNCLCLFVPDPANELVHILMPATNGHGAPEAPAAPSTPGIPPAAAPGAPAAHDGHHKHVVRVLHHSFEGEEKRVGRDMEGWALVLGPDDASADATLLPPPGVAAGGELPNLTRLTGKKVDPALVGKNPGDKVAARITLRSGRIRNLSSEATWEIGNQSFALAHQVTWQMSDVDHVLKWERLNDGPEADPPIKTLEELEPEDNLGYKLRIFHVTKEALPPTTAKLDPKVMREHYRVFYPLLGVDNPGNNLLPSIKDKGIGKVNCGASRAALG